MQSENTMSRLSSMFNDWIGVEASSTEQEVTKAVIEHYGGEALLTTKIYKDDGLNVLCEFDGIVFSVDQIILVEAKHRVTERMIDNEDPNHLGLTQRVRMFRDFLRNTLLDTPLDHAKVIKQRAYYKRFADCSVTGAIGGVHFYESVKTFAKRSGFAVVSTNGARYVVE